MSLSLMTRYGLVEAGNHLFERPDLCAGPRGIAGEYDACRDLWMTLAETRDHFESRVIGSAASEDNFEGRIVLKEQALKISFEARLGSVQWLEDRDCGERGID